MFSSPSESAIKSKRRVSQNEYNQTSFNTRRSASRASTSNQEDSACVVGLPLRNSERSIRWQSTDNLGYQVPNSRRFHSTVLIELEIFVFGGEQSNDKKKILLNDLVAFDPAQQAWRLIHSGKGENVPKPRKGHSLSVWGSHLVLFGGAGNQKYLNDVWLFDTSSDLTTSSDSPSWNEIQTKKGPKTALSKYVPDCPPPRAYHSAVIFENALYLHGGYGFSSTDVDIWKLDLISFEWIPILNTSPVKIRRRYGHIACCYQSTMFVFGGQVKSCLNDCDIYKFNFLNHEWTICPTNRLPNRRNTTPNLRHAVQPAAPCPRTYHAGALIEKCARWIVHGGSNEDSTFSDLYEFNLKSEKWRSIQCMTPFPLEGHSLIVIDYEVSYALLTIGGAPSGSAILSSPALRLDFLVPSSSSSQMRLEELIVPGPAMLSLWNHLKNFVLMEKESRHLKAVNQQCQESKKANKHHIEKLKNENEDLRIHLEDVTTKLETILKDQPDRYSTSQDQRSRDYMMMTQLKEEMELKEKMIQQKDKLIEKLRRASQRPMETNSREHLKRKKLESKFRCVEEKIDEIYGKGRDVILTLENEEPSIQVISTATASILDICNNLKSTIFSTEVTPDPSHHDESDKMTSQIPYSMTIRDVVAPLSEMPQLQSPVDLISHNLTVEEVKETTIKERIKSLSPTGSSKESLSVSHITSEPLVGIDIGLQAGHGKVKLYRSHRKGADRKKNLTSTGTSH